MTRQPIGWQDWVDRVGVDACINEMLDAMANEEGDITLRQLLSVGLEAAMARLVSGGHLIVPETPSK